MRLIQRLVIDQAQLLVVDIQERLIPHIDEAERMISQSLRMIRAAKVLGLPITVSEQYPRGLGATIPAVMDELAGAAKYEKTTFSTCADETARGHLLSLNRPQILLVGIETHVCVQQTALDLLELNLFPFVLADAVSSQRPLDRETALHRMRSADVVVTTVESAIYELMIRSGTELFKQMLPVVR